MAISTTPNALQDCSNQRIKVKLKNFRKELQQGNHLPVLSTSVLFASKVKIRRSMSYSLQSVDDVQGHIIGNVYPGTSKLNFSDEILFLFLFFVFLFFFPLKRIVILKW